MICPTCPRGRWVGGLPHEGSHPCLVEDMLPLTAGLFSMAF